MYGGVKFVPFKKLFIQDVFKHMVCTCMYMDVNKKQMKVKQTVTYIYIKFAECQTVKYAGVQAQRNAVLCNVRKTFMSLTLSV